jgi:hypothetical protein
MIAAAVLFATLAVTPANLKEAMAAAKGGDTLVLSGAFGDLPISGRAFAPPLTLDLTGATFGGLHVTSVTGLEVNGGVSHPASWFGGAYVMTSQHVHLHKLRFEGDGTLNAVTFRSSSDVGLDDAILTSPRVGVLALDVDNLYLGRVIVRGSTQDGFDITSATNVLVERITCLDNVPALGDHPDCVQLWNQAGLRLSDNVTVRDSIAIGPTQGFDDFGPAAGPNNVIGHLVLERNEVASSFPQGIAVYYSTSAIIRDNHVHTLAGAKDRTSINIKSGLGIIACGNTADPGGASPAWADAACAP